MTPSHSFPQRRAGFTLVEIAIVLVIVGLMLGGVLKGQELIDSAKVRNLAGDFRNIPVSLYAYQDRFRATPGDDPAAAVHLNGGIRAAGSGQTPGNGVIEGNWNSSSSTDESYLFWQHIRLAGFAAGATDPGAAAYLPTNAAGGTIGIQSGSVSPPPIYADAARTRPIRGAFIICSGGIPGKYARLLDIQMDDGDTAGGMMMAAPAAGYTAGAIAAGAAAIDDAAAYVVCMGA